MRVLHLFSGKELGGISSVVFPLLTALVERDCSVTALFLQEGPLLEAARRKGIDVTVIERRGTIDARAVLRIAGHARQGEYDLMHSHSIAGNLYGRLVRMLPSSVPLVTSAHADTWQEISDSTGSVLRAKMWFRTDLFMSRFSDMIVPNSRYIEQLLIHRGVPASKLRTIHNGIPVVAPDDIDKHRAVNTIPDIRSFSYVIGTVGRFTDSKNQQWLLQAAPLVFDRVPGGCLMMVGDGIKRPRLEQMAYELGIKDRVVFTGWTDDVYSHIAAMDVFVLPSRHEAFGIALLEAMALEKPVVAARTGGIAEVVEDGMSGFLVTPEAASELADGIGALLENPSQARDMGRRGRKIFEERFTLHTMTDSMISLYAAVRNKG